MSAVIETQQNQLTGIGSPDDLIRLAANGTISVDVLERLLAMRKDMAEAQSRTDFNIALTAAQSEMGRVATNAENSQTHSRYATYAQLDKALRPIYTKHGFALSFDSDAAPAAEHVRVICHVSHRGGYSKAYHVDMPADGKGAKGGDVMTKTHATGAAMSYGMRYLLKMIFNVAIGEDDQDGNKPLDKIDAKQLAELTSLIEEVKADKGRFLKYLKLEKLEDLPARAYNSAVKDLEAKRK